MGLETGQFNERNREKEGAATTIAVVGYGRVGGAITRFGFDADITALIRTAHPRTKGINHSTDFDITASVSTLRDRLRQLGIRTVINTAGEVGVDRIEAQRYDGDPTTLSAYQTNVVGARNLALACKDLGLKHILISTECVFDENETPRKKYPELLRPTQDVVFDETRHFPSLYGLTKALGEHAVAEVYPEAVIARLCRVEGPEGGLFSNTVRQLLQGKPFTRVSDMATVHLTDRMIAKALLDIEARMHNLNKETSKIYHISAIEPTTPYTLAQRFADQLGVSRDIVIPSTQEEYIASLREKGMTTTQRTSNVQLDITNYKQDFGISFPTSIEAVDQYLNLYKDLYV